MKKFLSCVKKKSSLSPNPSTPRSALPSGYEIIEKDLSKLHRAASRGDVRAIRQQLRKHDINGLDRENRTALHLACANGHTGAVTLLVGKNCKLNICDNEHRSPLIKALQCQQVQCASILLKHKVDPDIVDIIGNTALHYAVLIPSKSTVVQIFERGACLDTKNSVGCTPLILAVAISDKEIVEFLINKGVNIDAEDHQGRTPLMIASSNGHIGLVKTLLQHDVNIYKKDKTGWNAVDHAIMNGHDACSHLISSQQRWKRSPPFYNSNIVTGPSIFSSPDRVVENSFALGGPASDKTDLSDWEYSSCLSKDMPCNQLPADNSNNGILAGVELDMKCLTQPSEEKDLARKNAALQEEINALKQDLDQVKTSSQEKENRYIEEIKLLTEKVDDLRRELKMKEESFTETVLQYNGKVDALKTEAAMSSSKLYDELAIMYVKNNRLSLQLTKTEAKSNHLQYELHKTLLSFREKTLLLDNKQRDLAQGDARIKYLERMLQDQKEELSNSAVKQDSMQERLAQSVSENLLLRHQLEEAENKFTNLYNKLRTDTVRQIQTYEENNKDLINKSNELVENLYKVESEKLGRECTLMQLKQDLADALKKLSVCEASLEDIKLNSKVESDKKDKKLVDQHKATESRFEQKWKKCNVIQKENSGLRTRLQTN